MASVNGVGEGGEGSVSVGHQSSSVASGVSMGEGGVGEGGEGSVSSGVGDGEVSRGGEAVGDGEAEGGSVSVHERDVESSSEILTWKKKVK